MFKKHPRGIMSLFVVEMWERFGFYIMSAIYVLYMDKDLGFSDSAKGDFYGFFLFASYLFPLVGGFMGDRLIGQVPTIRVGSWMMGIGYVFLALSSADALILFYAGLAFVAIGTGIFKVNMSTLVGNLYHKKPELRDAGFNIYYMGVNVGAAIGPTAAGILGSISGGDYHLSFWAAAIGMALAIIFIELGKKHLIISDVQKRTKIKTDEPMTEEVQMDKSEYWQRITTLGVLFLIAALFWVPFYQNGFALTLFAERSTKIVFDWLRPETYVAFNAYFILLLTPPLLWFFARLRLKSMEPTTPAKITWGLMIMGCSMLIMVWASLSGGNSDTAIMSPLWLITTYLVITLAELLISPMGQSYVAKVAPPTVRGVMMGGWFLSTALGALSAGIFGKIYSDVAHHEYYLILAGLSFFAAILSLVFMKKLKSFAG